MTKERLTNDKKKAVAIAKDVLKWLKAGRMKAESMIYCHTPRIPTGSVRAGLSVVTKDKPCKVCALGALFIAAVDKFNKLDIPSPCDCFNDGMIREHLNFAFTERQLHEVEWAFERWQTDEIAPGMKDLNKAGQFVKDETNDTIRLEKICQNIIDNKGVFIP